MADPRERYGDGLEDMRTLRDTVMQDSQTALPGIVQSYNPAAQTVSVQLAIKIKVATPAGETLLQNRTVLVDCPVQFPAGAGHTLTFPISEGDEALVIFASRNIDAWHQSGGVQPAPTARTNNLSDGFVLLGFRSKPRVLSNVSSTTTQLRSDDGQSYVELDGLAQSVTLHSVATMILLDGAGGKVAIAAPNGVVVDGPTLACTGEVESGFGTAGVVHLSTHTHPTAEPGGPSSPTLGS